MNRLRAKVVESLSDLGAEILAESVLKAFSRDDARGQPEEDIIGVVPGADKFGG